MKPSHTQTPRTLNECQWTPGYTSIGPQRVNLRDHIAGYVLALLFGCCLAGLLFLWWPK
jgi:hypothetical protein